MTSYPPAEWIAAILYDDWKPLGANPPANEYLKEGRAIAMMLKQGASKEEIAKFLRQAAEAYGTYPVPEARLADVVDKILRVRS